MSLQNRIINHFSDSLQIQQDTLANLGELIEFASQRLVAALLNDKKILTCGNGRSAAVAQVLSSAMLNQYERDRPSLPAIALTGDVTTLTAIANDYHFDDVFAKQLRALGQSGDILVVYSDGENSANIAKAVSTAHDKDISVIALTGNNGGMIAPLLHETDIEIRVVSTSSAHIQEVHVLITHCLCDLIDHQLFGG
ncbi:MAG: SIS domain-containing protein [Methylobacter sp.]|nr:SIS domain-containing protein [Methylobacter sp.]MDP2098256.1 SIS domain-containing protein [Methylobacter sp.]MDP2426753.1 SIS domain-containing protein [Methylobacter sp.]MDP3054697.1 SIS domain-containing protein [Methylobacter sp.]MDP3361749.1 SIS domain-containing protein [Methylobacter sp.]